MNIETRPDRSEKVSYNTVGFPVYIRRGALSDYPNYAAISHWHDDVEFIAVLSGHMLYNINGNILRMEAGDGIFVNSRQLHYGFSDDKSECIFICILLHPVLLCASRHLEEAYIAPVLSDEAFPCHLLRRHIPWERSVLDKLMAIYKALPEDAAALKMQSLFFDIWRSLFLHRQPAAPVEKPQYHLSILKDMVAYIQKQFPEKITLADIARSGGIGKTICCTIFQRFTNQTPNAYLMEYRLQKGAELLLSTDMTIAEVCYAVGFSAPSYFAGAFRRSFSCSPSQYRKRRRQP